MSHSSNMGAIEAVEKGVATSWSVMMPCPWVVETARYLKDHPDVDSGVHLTFTSEWQVYRWGPLSGKQAVPGLVDGEGCFWRTVEDVTKHASPDEIETEIRAQIERAENLGMPITHLDTHMGTMFAHEQFFDRYVKVAAEKNIPILMIGGHMTHLAKTNPAETEEAQEMAERVWNAGLPVIDDLVSITGWNKKTERLIDTLGNLKPGITEFILHCSRPTDVFANISGSGSNRLSDTLTMTDPKLKKFIEKEGIILTTWRELKERRDKADSR
jgi:predicted glycoside hydrolase/deacetylase ChbG (UPF0249 family)